MVIDEDELKCCIREVLNNPGTKNKKYKLQEIKKKIWQIISKEKDDLSLQDISGLEIKNILDELASQGEVYIDDRNKKETLWTYRAFPRDLGYVFGIIRINKHGEGTLDDGKVKYRIGEKDLNDALDGDKVILRAKSQVNGHQKNIRAKVEKIISRKDGLIICEVTEVNEKMVLRPFNCILNHDVVVERAGMKALVDGDLIQVRLPKRASGNCFFAEFVEYLGHKNDPRMNEKLIAAEYNIDINFSEAAMKQAEGIKQTVTKEDWKGREDFTFEPTISIDGAKTKDRDDAFDIHKDSEGNYIVNVHIADVSHYVPYGTVLWDEAINRGTSVYMSDTVIPMLPHILSDGICSLNPNVNRLVLTFQIKFSKDGEILEYDFIDSVIRSKRACTYDEVNELLESKIDGEYTYVPKGLEPFVEMLDIAWELSRKLEKRKIARGYINFGTNDLETEIDEDGKPIGFHPKAAGPAEKIIENLMLSAGEVSAYYLTLPAPFRVHAAPDEDRVDEAMDLLSRSGIRVKGQHKIINGNCIQAILNGIKDMKTRDIAAQIILRSMNHAGFSTDYEIGHFGLGYQKYLQVTSPIRRGGDLMNHYLIRCQRDNKFDYASDQVQEFNREMIGVASHLTYKERKADDAEREADKENMAVYMADHINEKYPVRITYVNNRGIYVKMGNGVLGKIAPEDLKGDKFVYDDASASFKGKKSKRKLRIGTGIIVTCLDTRREYRTVNFGLMEEDYQEFVHPEEAGKKLEKAI